MPSRWLLLIVLIGSSLCSLTGCDKLPFGGSSDAALEDDLSDLGDFGDLEATGDAQDSPGGLAAAGKAADAATGMSSAPSFTADPSELAVQLSVGERFPLIKTVEQRLTQQLPQGPVVGHTRLELRLSLIVEQQRDDGRCIGVRYHRVRYSQDLGGQSVFYDSDAPTGTVPPACIAYTGLKDNGFSFWLGADNRVRELVGFPEFLQRCVAVVPVEQRHTVLQQLGSLRSEDGLASFVDDSIGLLPNPVDPQWTGQRLQVGSRWEARGQMTGQAATAGGLQCLLKELTADHAEIALMGTIGPSNYVDDVRQLKLTVRGGQCSGVCIVDRKSGMPTQSRIDRVVDMVAQLADGTEIPQRKEVVTTVTAFLDQRPTEPTAISRVGYAAPANASPAATWAQ